MNVIRDFFKIKETKIGLAAGFLFLICFFGVWMTVYQNIDDRADQLHVVLVNQDSKISHKEITTLKNKNSKKIMSKIVFYIPLWVYTIVVIEI